MSVILAGHETTASEMAWALQLLAHNPPVAARLADSIAAGNSTPLRATMYEVLRRRPVFLFTIPRICNRPHELGGRTYLPSEQLVGCIHLMHHDPRPLREPRPLPARSGSSPPSRRARSGCRGEADESAAPAITSPRSRIQIVLRAVVCRRAGPSGRSEHRARALAQRDRDPWPRLPGDPAPAAHDANRSG